MSNLNSPGKNHTEVEKEKILLTIPPEEKRQRLDLYIINKVSGITRSSLSKLIRDGYVTVGGQSVKPGYKIRSGDQLEILVPTLKESTIVPEEIEFEVIFEDDDLLVINKPPGLVVHPAAGHQQGTLVNGLLYRYHDLPNQAEGRPGIVHRLDKNTSGIMVVAKTEYALRQLSEEFKQRRVQKKYHAVLISSPAESHGHIVAPIGRHPVNRKKMAIRQGRGRYAASSYRIIEYFANGWCFAEVEIETGRTHQIRVHMASLHASVSGDDLYGGKVNKHSPVRPSRQLLHASIIEFLHPVSGKTMKFTASFWPDMQQCLTQLRGLPA